MRRNLYQEREGKPEMRLIPIMAFALLAIATACGNGEGEQDPSDPPEETDAAPAEPAIDEGDVTVYFLRQARDAEIEVNDMEAPGQLVLDDAGCLRLEEDGPIIIWPGGFSVDLIDGEVALIDEESGDVIAFVGDDVNLHGTPSDADWVEAEDLEHPVPEACEAGGYLLTGEGITGPEE
jgi:hypothetical protein